MMRTKRTFASVMQAVLIVLLIVSLLLIAQQQSLTLYQAGLLLLVVATFVQIGFGNIPPTASFKQSMKLLGLAMAIIAVVFGLGVVLAPYLIKLARG